MKHQGVSNEIEEAFDKAVEVFLRKGLDAVTISDLAEVFDTSEEQLLKDYKSEHGVLKVAINWHANKISRLINAEMAMHADLYLAMEALLRSVVDLCFDMHLSNNKHSLRTIFELLLQEERFRSHVKEMFSNWISHIHDKIVQASPELKETANVDTLTHYIVTVMEGLYDLTRYGAQKETMHQVVDMSLIVIASQMKISGNDSDGSGI